jgi:non-ribosomal peptide synthetase component F
MNEPFDHLINRQKRISDSTLAHAFEQRATRTPDAAAVTWGQRSDVAELDVLASRLRTD